MGYGEIMKFLLCIALFMLSVQSFANCSITSTKDDRLQNIINENKGWNFDNYDVLCAKLKKAKAGLQINQVTMISEYQTSVATAVKAYSLDIEKKYGAKLLTISGYVGIASNPKRTTNVEDELRYVNANYVLNELVNTKEIDSILNDLNKMSAILK